MTKIFEALEQLELERSGAKDGLGSKERVRDHSSNVSPQLSENLVELYRSIVALAPAPNGRIIQFVETSPGSGCAPIIRLFAQVVSSLLNKSVLLLDANPQSPGDFNFLNPRARRSWLEGLQESGCCAKGERVGNGALFISHLFEAEGLTPVGIDSRQAEEFLQLLKTTIDLTLVDSWQQSGHFRPAVFSAHVDGLVLVVEAGKTRWQIVEQMKREIIAQGGNILGVVLNKRSYPIPQGLYRRL